MITLSKNEIVDLTNRACALLQNADMSEPSVLAFEESGNTVTPRLLTGSEVNGKCDLFPRDADPSVEIYAHLAALYGNGDNMF